MGRGQDLLLHGRQQRGAGAVPGQVPGLSLQVPANVPLRPHRRRHQARRGRLRRHRLHHLHHFGGAVGHSRRDRLRVPGQRQRPTLHAPHQHIRQRRGWPRDAVPALVRRRRRLPHLHHHLEPQAHRHPGGRADDPGVRQQRGPGGAVPVVAAAAGVREPVERGGLGDAGRADQDRLVPGALRLLLQELHRLRVPAVARRQLVRQRARRLHPLQPRPEGPRRPAVGQRQRLPHLQLLRGPRQVQRNHHAQGVHAPASAMRIRHTRLCWFHRLIRSLFLYISEETGTCVADSGRPALFCHRRPVVSTL